MDEELGWASSKVIARFKKNLAFFSAQSKFPLSSKAPA
jgi:hypothetical protein